MNVLAHTACSLGGGTLRMAKHYKDEKIQFNGSLLSRFGGKQDRSEIIRLDRDLECSIKNRREQYKFTVPEFLRLGLPSQ